MSELFRKRQQVVHRGDVFWVDVPKDDRGSEQHGHRLIVVVQNDVGNKFSPTFIGAFITSQKKNNLATHVNINLMKPSTITCEQIRTLSKERLEEFVRELTSEELKQLDYAIMVSTGLVPVPPRYEEDFSEYMEDEVNE